MAKIAVLGYGVVGSGVVEVLSKHKNSILKKSGEEISVKYIIDLRDFPGDRYESLLIKDYNIAVNDPEIDVVVECIGGCEPAYTFVKKFLESGKSVVTSNKELIATKGYDLLNTAMENNVYLLFEASVGGGVPIIRPMNQCLAANEITDIAGIVNGTTNFILTKMVKENMEFDEALNLALDLGYAERTDQSADVDGIDACRKICILSSLAFGKHLYPENVSTDGIRNITKTDVEYAKICGGVIKLIARTKKTEDDKILAAVSAAVVGSDSQLATIEDVFNGILVRGDVLGDVVFYGRGAGKLPTASAVVADIIDIVKNGYHENRAISWKDMNPEKIASSDLETVEMLVRYKGEIADGKGIKKLPDIDGFNAVLLSLDTIKNHEIRIKEFENSGAKIFIKLPLLDY